MEVPEGLPPDARVLVLGPPPAGSSEYARILRLLAGEVPLGLVVALGPDEAVRECRRALADCENVMCVPATPDDIPWQDGFFTHAVDPFHEWSDPARVAAELARVVAKP